MSAVHAAHRFAAFRHVGYRRYFFSRFLAYFAVQIMSVAVGWQIYDLTRDPFALGLIGLSSSCRRSSSSSSPAAWRIAITAASSWRFACWSARSVPRRC
jgi:hypothetical protein